MEEGRALEIHLELWKEMIKFTLIVIGSPSESSDGISELLPQEIGTFVDDDVSRNVHLNIIH